jgi:hypothetical protein
MHCQGNTKDGLLEGSILCSLLPHICINDLTRPSMPNPKLYLLQKLHRCHHHHHHHQRHTNAGQQVAVVTKFCMVAPTFLKNLYTPDQYYFTSRHWYMEKTAAFTFTTTQEQYAALYTVWTGQTQSTGSLGRVVGTCQYNRKRIFQVNER